MARLGIAVVGGLAGAYLGGLVGNPVLGAQLGFAAGLAIGGLLFPEKLPTQIGPRLSDLAVTTSNYGAPIRKVYATFRLGGQVIWSPPINQTKQTTSTGGGLTGAPSGKLVNFSYDASWAIAFCEGPKFLLQLFADGKLIYDCKGQNIEVGNLGLEEGGLEIYTGTFTQLPSPTIQADPTGLGPDVSPQPTGVDITPAYRGVFYIVLKEIQLADFANRRPVITATVTDIPPVDIFLGAESPQERKVGIGRGQVIEGGNLIISANNGAVTIIDLIEGAEIANIVPERSLGMQTDNSLGHRAIGIDRNKNIYINSARTVGRSVERFDYPAYNYTATTGFTKDMNTPVNNTFGFMGGSEGQTALISNPRDPLTGDEVGFQFGFAVSGTSIYVFDTMIDPNVLYAENDNVTIVPAIPIIAEHNLTTMYGDTLGLWHNIIQSNLGVVWSLTFQHSGTNKTDIRIVEMDGNSGVIRRTFIVTMSAEGGQGTHATYVPSPDPLLLPDDDYILLANRGGTSVSTWFHKVDLITETITDTLELSFIAARESNNIQWTAGPDPEGRFWVQETDVDAGFWIREFDAFAFEFTGKEVDARNWGYFEQTGVYFDYLRRAFVTNEDGTSVDADLEFIYCERCDGDPNAVPLSVVITDICGRVNLTPADLDVSQLTTTFVEGFVINDRMPAREAIDSISAFYQFRVHESDWKIVFPKYGGSVSRFIPDEDLGAGTNPRNPIKLEETMGNPITLPRQIDFVYSNPDTDYQSMTQTSRLPSGCVDSDGLSTINVPVASASDYAKRSVEINMFTLWNQKDGYSLTTQWDYIDIDPNDIVQFQKNDVVFDMLVRTADFGADLSIRLTGVREGIFTYVETTAPGADADANPGQTIQTLSRTEFFLIDTVLLRDIDEGLGIVASAGQIGINNTWPGAQLLSSKSSSITDFNQINFFGSGMNAVQGFAVGAALGDFSDNTWDEQNTVTVNLWSGSLASDSDINVLNGANAGVLGQEVIQWVNVVLNADGTYTLSRLLRGRRGSNHATAHVPGEDFIALDPSHQVNVRLTEDDVGDEIFFLAPTAGRDADTQDQKSLTFNANNRKPLSVSHIQVTQDSDLDWNFEWIRRTRIGQDWNDLVDSVLGETIEQYRIDILDDDETTIIRSIDTLVESATYTQAQQAADFGGLSPNWDSNLIADIYQRNGDGVAGWKKRVNVLSPYTMTGPIEVLQWKAASAQAQTVDVTLDAAPTVGNLIVLLCASEVDSVTGSDWLWDTPSGWTILEINPENSHRQKTGIFWKISDGTETTVQLSFTNDHSSDQCWAVWYVEVSGATVTSPGDLGDFHDDLSRFEINSNQTSWDLSRINLTNEEQLQLCIVGGTPGDVDVSGFVTDWNSGFIKFSDLAVDPTANDNLIASAGYKIIVDGKGSSVNISSSHTINISVAQLWGIK